MSIIGMISILVCLISRDALKRMGGYLSAGESAAGLKNIDELIGSLLGLGNDTAAAGNKVVVGNETDQGNKDTAGSCIQSRSNTGEDGLL